MLGVLVKNRNRKKKKLDILRGKFNELILTLSLIFVTKNVIELFNNDSLVCVNIDPLGVEYKTKMTKRYFLKRRK